jgi:hypothetical protein
MRRLALLLLLGLALSLPAGVVTYEITRATVSPRLDGVLDDACWKTACVVDHFALLGGGDLPTDQPASKALLTFDDDAIYVALDFAEPLVAKIKATATEPDGKTWMDDGVEIFLNPSGDRQRYVQLAINTLGVIMDGAKDSPDDRMDMSWNSGAKAVAKLGKDSWQMEVRIPFARLPLDGPTKDWTFHIARNRRVASQHLTSLQSPVSGFHEIAKFDVLRGVRPKGYDVSVRAIDLGQFLRGPNRAAAEFQNWGATLQQVHIRYGVAGREQEETVALKPDTTIDWQGLWPLDQTDAGKEFSFTVRLGDRVIQRRTRAISAVPPIFPGLSRTVFYLRHHSPVRLELPLNLAGGQQRDGVLNWTALNPDGEAVGHGQTLVRAEPVPIRLYWNRWLPGNYTLRCELRLPDEKPITFESKLRLVRNPWGE